LKQCANYSTDVSDTDRVVITVESSPELL